jgi:hypothetical protein
MRTPVARRAALAGTLVYALYAAAIRPWIHRWDAELVERGDVLPGDTLISAPASVETRAVTVDAPPPAVWPWLVQMGDGRAGWYSYDRPPGASVWRLIPQFEDLEVGSVLHLHPDAAFRVVRLEHERTLVLSLDPLVGCAQAAMLREHGSAPIAHGALGMGITWTFVLRPLPGGRTRLLERVRIAIPQDRVGPRILNRLAAFGVFLAQRKQLLGIKARAERTWHGHIEEPVQSHVA